MKKKQRTSKLRLAISMGDPAGIGGEVILKALHRLDKKSESVAYIVVGSFEYLRALAQRWAIPFCYHRISSVPEAQTWTGSKGILDLGDYARVPFGKISATCGALAVQAIQTSVDLIRNQWADALVTAPINKEAIHRSGCHFPGHTELLASYTHSKSFAMMMVGGPFRIVLQSIHLSLTEAIQNVRPQLIIEKLELTRVFLKKYFAIHRPKIAVAGLNPHASENGAFGSEENKILKPVIQRLQKKGWNISGPHPPDTLYYWASKGHYDAILAMYHDQGLIPLKLLAFDTGVNLTLGLPFVRTSPDHGTAFDIAGQGKAEAQSMISAIQLAQFLAGNQKRVVPF